MTRPYFRYRCALPDGLVQGASYFSAQGGMGVVSVGGYLYRLRIGPQYKDGDTYEAITMPQAPYPNAKRVWMCQTVESLVVQNFIDTPIIYDGSDARLSKIADGEVPKGRQMAYGNGRLWVATDEQTLVAGDIKQREYGTELLFTETNYLSGGGSFTFPRGITALGFIPTTGTSDYGALMVYSADTVDSLRADVTDRDSWASIPSFITTVLRHSGCAGQTSLVEVNQDLYWRDSEGGIRSIRAGMADESGAGNSPISWEVSRLTNFDSHQLLDDCPAINFGNRLLIGSSPFLNPNGGTSWKALVALDFAPISTMAGKSSPEYDGEWAGLNITHMFTGKFNGVQRAFAIHCGDKGDNSLWEIMPDNSSMIADRTLDCTESAFVDSRVTCYEETRSCDFGEPTHKKRLERIDVYLAEIQGRVDVELYWRTDNNQKWQKADEMTFCAQMSDPVIEGETSHAWKNLRPQQRVQMKAFTLPVSHDAISKYALHTGFRFQFRVVWTGHMKRHMLVAHASALNETQYAMRVQSESCVSNDVT